MTMQELFKDYMHYGVIEKREDFEFKEDGILITMFIISCGDIARLFFLRNGEVVHTELLKRG